MNATNQSEIACPQISIGTSLRRTIGNLTVCTFAMLAMGTASPAHAQAPKTPYNSQQALQQQLSNQQQFLQQQQQWFGAIEHQQLYQQKLMQQWYAQQVMQEQMMMQQWYAQQQMMMQWYHRNMAPAARPHH